MEKFLDTMTFKPKVRQVLGKNITDCRTSAEAMQTTGLDFEVLKRPTIHPLPCGLNVISEDGESKFKSILYGDGLKKNQNAFDLCLNYMQYGADILKFN